MKTLTLTVSSSLRGLPAVAPLLTLFSPVGHQPFRGYPRLTAPNRGKTRLFAPNRAKNFSGGSRGSIRGCATEPATAPQHPATSCTNSHQLAALAPTCAEKNLRRRIAFGVPPSGNLPVLRAFVVSFFHIGKSSELKPWIFFPPNPTRNPDLTPRPGRGGAPRRPSAWPPLTLTLTPCNQATAIVANCRRSKIRPKTCTLNLNTASFVNRKSPIVNGASLNTPALTDPSCSARCPQRLPLQIPIIQKSIHPPIPSARTASRSERDLSAVTLQFRGRSRLFEVIWGARPHRGEGSAWSLTFPVTVPSWPTKSLRPVTLGYGRLRRITVGCAQKFSPTPRSLMASVFKSGPLHICPTRLHKSQAQPPKCAPMCTCMRLSALACTKRIFSGELHKLHIGGQLSRQIDLGLSPSTRSVPTAL